MRAFGQFDLTGQTGYSRMENQNEFYYNLMLIDELSERFNISHINKKN